jgi:hypothetical protein
MEKLIYTPPMIEVIEVKVEKGYAASTKGSGNMEYSEGVEHLDFE